LFSAVSIELNGAMGDERKLLGLTGDDYVRYSRQIMLEEIGPEGQKKLKNSRVFVIGTGGLASPVLYYLAAAGVGTITVIDSDTVELSNLNRQIIHSTYDIGRPKVLSVEEKIKKLNPSVNFTGYYERLTRQNACYMLTLDNCDIVVDCVDNLDTRYLVNDVCCKNKVPFVEAGVRGFEGYVMTVVPGKTPCFRCFYPKNEASCGQKAEVRTNIASEKVTEDGEAAKEGVKTGKKPEVLGVTAAIAGSIEAAEAIKFILGIGESLSSNILIFNILNMKYEKISLKRNPVCPACGAID